MSSGGCQAKITRLGVILAAFGVISLAKPSLSFQPASIASARFFRGVIHMATSSSTPSPMQQQKQKQQQQQQSAFSNQNLRGLFVGSGSDGLNESIMCETILALSGKQGPPKVLYLGTATYDLEGPRQRQTLRFIEAGCQVSSLDVATACPSKRESSAAIQAADVIIVSGGNTLWAVDRWNRLGIDQDLREAMMRGAVLTGGSAGAICWFDAGHSDSADPDTFKRLADPISPLRARRRTEAHSHRHTQENTHRHTDTQTHTNEAAATLLPCTPTATAKETAMAAADLEQESSLLPCTDHLERVQAYVGQRWGQWRGREQQARRRGQEVEIH